jgi:parvulin-like peptidyl-prolyl isomerase
VTQRLGSRTTRRRRGLFPGDDRRDTLVILGFVGLIALLGVGLLLAFGLAYYDQNLRPLARVGGTEISPAHVRDRTALDGERITRDRGRLRVLQTNNEIDVATLSSKSSELDTRLQGLSSASVTEELIDLMFQSQLAATEGVSPSDADVSAAVDAEFSAPERRHILLIVVKPESTGEARPSVAERAAAVERAKQALAALQGGADWATVAAQYSSDPGASAGGDGGVISENNPVDPSWVKALFALPPGGTTGIVAALGCARADGGECVYRIGRVSEIQPGQPDTNYRDRISAKVSDGRLREIIGWELAAERLREKIIGQVTTGAVDQVHLAEIIIRNTEIDEEEPADESPSPAPSATPNPAADGEIHYSQILYAPKDDPEGAPDVPANDPSWTTAENEAKAAFNELNELTDPQARSDRFAEIAKAVSDDDATKDDGGDIDFTTRELVPDEVAKALFDSEHQNGDLVGPVKDEFGWYVLLFHEHRGTPQERLAELKAEIAAGADWNALVEKYSDAEDADKVDGGDIGWYSRDMLTSVEDETVEKLFALKAGDVSEPIVFGTDSLIFKALEHASRELDPNQLVQLTDPDFGTYADWYSDKKTEAETNRVIVRAGEEAPPEETPTPSP